MQKKELITRLSTLTTLFLITIFSVEGAVFTSAQSGNFSNGSTWIGGNPPGYGDDIVIAAGHTVTLDGNVTVFNITIESGAVIQNGAFNLSIGRTSVGNPVYTNNGIHNGQGKLLVYNDFKTEITGNGTTNCSIEISSYGLYLTNTCNLTVNGNIQHTNPGNNGMNGKILIEAWQAGTHLTINGDIITDPFFGGVGIENMAANITVNGNVSLPGSSVSGTGALIRNGASASFYITGNLTLGPYFSYCANYGEMSIGGDLLGSNIDETWFLQGVNAYVKFGGQVFPESNPGYFEPLLDENFSSAEPNLVEYNGTSSQVIKIPGSGAYSNLSINNSSGIVLTVPDNLNIYGDLILVNGMVEINNNHLVLADTSQILGSSSANSMVIATGTGELRKIFTSPGSFSFPVGDNTGEAEYSPVDISFSSGSFNEAYVGVNLVNEPFPGSSGSFLNRYWKFSVNGIDDFVCDLQFHYSENDITGNENDIFCYRVLPTVNPFTHADTSLNILSADMVSLGGAFTGKQADSSLMPALYEVTGSGEYCQGGNGMLVGLSGSEIGVTYTLIKDGIAQSQTVDGTGYPIDFGLHTEGLYTVQATNYFGTLVMNGFAQIIEVTSIEVTATITSDDDEICEGSQINFYAITTGQGNNPTYQWTVNGIPAGNNLASFTYFPENNDAVQLILTSSETCTVNNPVVSNIIAMTVHDLPLVSWPVFDPDTMCINWEPVLLAGGLPAGGIYTGTGVTDNYFYPSVAGPGEFWLSYTYSNAFGCIASDSLNVFVDVCTASEIVRISKIHIYPVPADDHVFVHNLDGLSILNYELVNANGLVVKTGDCQLSGASVINIATNSLPAGYYLLKVFTSDACFIEKLIKK